MKKQMADHRIEFLDEEKENCVMGYVTFPQAQEGVWELDHTVVDKGYQGRGLAAQLVESVAQEAQKQGMKIQPTCSYAVKWFEKHKECEHLLK